MNMKEWIVAAVVLASLIDSSYSEAGCPKEFTMCPQKDVIISVGEPAILFCRTAHKVMSCEWRTPFAKDGITVVENDEEYKKYDSPDDEQSCTLQIVTVKEEDYGNWTCTPAVEGERTKPHSTPAFVSFATTPQPPYIVVNEKVQPKTVNLTEGHPVTVACREDGARPAPGVQWYLGNPNNGSIIKNLTDYSITKSTLIDDKDHHQLMKTISNLILREDHSMNGYYIWCNLTHLSLQPGDGYMAVTKLNISYAPKFTELTSHFEFEVNTKASLKIQFMANPPPTEDHDVKLLIGSRDSVTSGKSSDDESIFIGKAEPVEGLRDTYEVEITFKEITIEQTKNNYLVSVTNHLESPSMHKFIVVVTASGKKDNNIGVIIAAVVSGTFLIFLIAFSVYAYKKSKFCFAPSDHKSVPTDPEKQPQRKPTKRSKEMRDMTLFKRDSKEEQDNPSMA